MTIHPTDRLFGNKNLSYKIIFGIMLAMSLLVSLMMFVFSYSNSVLEHELLQNQNAAELERLKDEFSNNPDYQLPQTAKLHIYKINGDKSSLPLFLRSLPTGYNDEIELEDSAYFVLVSEFDHQTIYIVNDISEFEKSENTFALIIAISWAILMVLIFAVSYLLSSHLLKPISEFAEEIDRLQPEQRGLNLSGKYNGLEIEKMARAIDRYLSKMDEYVEKQRSFSAMASHELRTPLTIVQTSAELIASQTTNEQILSQCEKIIRSSTNMTRMILALLSITRDQPLEEKNSEIALLVLVQEALDNMSNEIRLNKIEVDNCIDPDSTLKCNRSLLSVVISNLLSNAIKHSPQGQIRITFENFCLSIIDNGSGLESGDIEQLFKFGVAGENNGGYGLGLYITQLICVRQGWLLDLQSADPGTIASVTFLSKARTIN